VKNMISSYFDEYSKSSDGISFSQEGYFILLYFILFIYLFILLLFFFIFLKKFFFL